jgi:hypothetical protein
LSSAASEEEEFFNGKDELSGVVLLKRTQSVCLKKENEFVQDVKLGQLMLQGVEDKTAYGALASRYFEPQTLTVEA